MSESLYKKKIGELVEVFNHIRIPLSANQRSKLQKIYPYYGAQGIVDYVDNFLFDGEYLLVAEDGENLRSNNQNICNLVKGKFWVNNHAHILRANNENDNKYLYYNFNRIKFEPYVTGSSQPKLNKENLLNIVTSIHLLEDQQKIASVLSALDDKIELNNRINAELEAMAKTLYDYWFVQFDFPVESHCEERGTRDEAIPTLGYKSSGGKMVYNEVLKREIPEGWEVKKLKNIAEIIMGQSPKGDSYNIVGNGILLINGAADYDGNYLNPRIFTSEPTRLSKRNDLIFCIRATIGKLTYSEKEYCLGRGVASVRINNDEFREYIYFSINQEIERFKKHASGSIIIGITKEDLTDYFVLLPNYKSLNRFHKIIKPIHQKIRKNLKQNQELSTLRDWLLPMMMNGQVKVK